MRIYLHSFFFFRDEYIYILISPIQSKYGACILCIMAKSTYLFLWFAPFQKLFFCRSFSLWMLLLLFLSDEEILENGYILLWVGWGHLWYDDRSCHWSRPQLQWEISNNNFKGEIPKSLGKLKSLKGLNFSHNDLMVRVIMCYQVKNRNGLLMLFI